MNPSDFLIVLTIAIAIWAFVPSKERRFILLFFSNFEIALFAIAILYIHFLMAFDWLSLHWWWWLSNLTIHNGIPPAIWAYTVSLLLISYPIAKINLGFFAKGKLNHLLNLYRTLLDTDEIDLLSNYILKYHAIDIQKYLVKLSELPERNRLDIMLRHEAEDDKAYEELTEPTRMKFAEAVYWNTLNDEQFVKKAADKYPELFAIAFKGMQSQRTSNRDLIPLYLGYLFENKNQKFIQELKVLNGSRASIVELSKQYDLMIMESLMNNTIVAAKNYVWLSIGNGALKSLKFDEEQKDFLSQEYDDDLENELWHQRVFIAIVYFNYMVRETIYRDSEWHMWLFYYERAVRQIIENIPEESSYVANSETPSFNHYLISEIISNMRDWIDLAADENTSRRTIDTIRCFGEILEDIANADIRKLSNEFKARIFELVIDTYFELSKHEHHEVAETIRAYMEKMFKRPKNPDVDAPEFTQNFRTVLSQAWDDFDKVPFEGFENNGSIQRFAQNVLHPLGIPTEGLIDE